MDSPGLSDTLDTLWGCTVLSKPRCLKESLS
jgi:hypothetical protein